MASEKQIQANRENARKSTGPITADGKARSSVNAVKHGLLSRSILTNAKAFGWDEVDLEEFVATLRADLQPRDFVEEMYCDEIVAATLRLPLIARHEAKETKRHEATEIANAVGIEQLAEQSDIDFVARIVNREGRYFDILTELLINWLKLNKSIEFEDAVSHLPGFALRTLFAPLPDLDLREFHLAEEEYRHDLKNILALEYSTWRRAESLRIQRERLHAVLFIIQNAKSIANRPEAFSPTGTAQAPRLDLTTRYEKHLLSVRREAIRLFEQRRTAGDRRKLRESKSETITSQFADLPNEPNQELSGQ